MSCNNNIYFYLKLSCAYFSVEVITDHSTTPPCSSPDPPMAASTAIVNSATALAAVKSRHHHLSPKFASISLIHGLRGFRPSPVGLAHNRDTNGYSLPIIRAQKSSGTHVAEDRLYYCVFFSDWSPPV